MRSGLVAVFAAMVMVLTGCASGAEQTAPVGWGDCTTRVRFHGVVYRSLSTQQTPRTGRPLGSSHYYGCAGEPIPGDTTTVRLHAAVGLDPDVALLVREKDGRDYVYIPRSMRRRDFPARLAEAMRYPRCTAQASFTGTWWGVTPGSEDYDITVPYAATFEARHGTGLGFDKWSTVTLVAKVTAATRAVPTAKFLDRDMGDDVPVAVTTVCRGTAFEVSSVKFAD